MSMKFFVPADGSAGPNSVTIPLPAVPSSTLRFSVPRPGLDIQISPAHFRKVTPSGGTTTLEAVLPATDRALISWSPAVREEISGTLRVQAQVKMRLPAKRAKAAKKSAALVRTPVKTRARRVSSESFSPSCRLKLLVLVVLTVVAALLLILALLLKSAGAAAAPLFAVLF